MDHPSLRLPFDLPSFRPPQRSMDPYAPCWCGSGTKFKWCHFRRDRGEKVSLREVMARMARCTGRAGCAYPSAPGVACGRKATAAHTVQRRGALDAIAEGGHVLDFKPRNPADMEEHHGRPPPKLVGVGKASTFPGFCNAHDAVFHRIERNSLVLGKEEALLFAFRAAALERYRKEVELEAASVMRDMDRGHDFERQVLVQLQAQAYEHGVRRGLRDVAGWKNAYDARILAGDARDMRFLAVTFDGLLPIAMCGAFFPEYDVRGTSLQMLGRGDDTLEHLTLNIAAYGGRSIAVFAWLGQDDGPAARFVRSLADMPHERMADAFVRLALEFSENVYVRPSWWGELGPADRDRVMSSVWNIPGRHPRHCLAARETLFASSGVVEVIRN